MRDAITIRNNNQPTENPNKTELSAVRVRTEYARPPEDCDRITQFSQSFYFSFPLFFWGVGARGAPPQRGWGRALRPRPLPVVLVSGVLVVAWFGSLTVVSRPPPPVRAPWVRVGH